MCDGLNGPHLHGLDWSAVRDRTMPDAAPMTFAENLARVINIMLAELYVSHTRY
jgi:carboxyl-terminal processing protease